MRHKWEPRKGKFKGKGRGMIFIELTPIGRDASGHLPRDKCVVNLEQIAVVAPFEYSTTWNAVDQRHMGAEVLMMGGEKYHVQETVDAVVQRMNKASEQVREGN